VTRLLRYGFSVSAHSIITALALAALQAAALVSMLYATGKVVGALSLMPANPGTGLPVLAPALLLGVAFVLNVALSPILVTILSDVVNRVTESVAAELARAGIEPPTTAHLDDPAFAAERQRARGLYGFDISVGVRTSIQTLAKIASAVLLTLLIGDVYSWSVGLAALASTLAVNWYLTRTFSRQTAVWNRQTDEQLRYDYTFWLALQAAAKEVRTFGLRDLFLQRYLADWSAMMQRLWRGRQRELLRTSGVMAVHVAVIGTLCVLCVTAATGGHLAAAAVTVALAALIALAGTQAGIDPLLIARGATALEALNHVRQISRDSVPGAVGASPAAAPLCRRSIVFDSVCFGYPGSASDVLHDFNLEITAGERVAFVGENGAGKSTFVKLLAGCYRPDSGRVLIDGIDLATLPADQLARWQRCVSAVVDDFMKLPLTARWNVEMPSQAGSWDDARLAAVAGRTGIADVISGLPGGWNTTLDPDQKGGVDLSGGQWLKLALARAVYAVNAGATVLVLDEPASVLDVRAEAELIRQYLDLTSGMTSLVISHRLSVVRDVRRICVVRRGRIIEDGSHDELIRLSGEYAQMFEFQAESYTDEAGSP